MQASNTRFACRLGKREQRRTLGETAVIRLDLVFDRNSAEVVAELISQLRTRVHRELKHFGMKWRILGIEYLAAFNSMDSPEINCVVRDFDTAYTFNMLLIVAKAWMRCIHKEVGEGVGREIRV